jgi:hypothetical protein
MLSTVLLVKPADKVSGLGSFAGHWNVHGAQMDLRADGTGTVPDFDEPQQTISVRWTRYRSPDRLLTVVTKVAYNVNGRPARPPSDPCALADGTPTAGDRSLLHVAAAHLLVEETLPSREQASSRRKTFLSANSRQTPPREFAENFFG